MSSPWIQGNQTNTNQTTTPVTLAFVTQNTTAGSLLCGLVRWNTGPSLTGVSDNQGNPAYTVISLGTNLSFFYCLNTIGGTKPTISIVFSSNPSANVIIAEYPLAAAGAFHTSNNGTGSSTNPTTAAITPAVGDLLLAVLSTQGGWTTASLSAGTCGASATLHTGATVGSSTFGVIEDGIAASASSQTASLTDGTTSVYQDGLIAFSQSVVATSTFSPVAGAYGPTQSVTVSNTNSGLAGFAQYYTTDGTTPTTGSTLVSGAISISATCTLKVLAVATGWANSAIASAAYTINGAVATSTFSPVAGTYTGTQSVTVSNANSALPGFAQYYTTNGSTPTTGSTLVSGAISVSASETLKVLAVATNYSNSNIASAAYVINTSGYGIGTVKTSGASIAAKMCNGSGYGLPITSQATSGNMNQPMAIVFCDKDGNELAVTGSTTGVFQASPTPVVLCTPAGLPITPTITLTSNGNSVVVTATKTGKNFGKPIPVCLTDFNGFAYLTTGFSSFGAFIANPTPITLTDINGNIITLLIGA